MIRRAVIRRSVPFLPLLFSFSLIAAGGTLDGSIREKIAGFHGTVSLYAKNLQTGQTYSLAGDQPVRTASTIKLPVMIECFAENAEGKLDLNEKLKLTANDKVSGSGVLNDLSDNIELPVRDVIDLMIVLSDNTATNLILSRIGTNPVNARMAQLGLNQTRIMRKVMGDNNDSKPSGISAEGEKPENKKYGLGRTSPQEMVTLLEKLYRGEIVSKSASDAMLTILKRQQDHNGIARYFDNVTVANKSGALDALRSDVGIVYVPKGPVAMAITVDGMPESNWSPDNPGLLLIAKLAEIVVQGLAGTAAPAHP